MAQYMQENVLMASFYFVLNGYMMTSSNRNIFRFTGPLSGEPPVIGGFPTNASDAELWCFLWAPPEQTIVQTIETPVIWGGIAPIMTSL